MYDPTSWQGLKINLCVCACVSSLQSSTSFNRDVVKAGTGRRFLGGLLDDTSYCYTLEVSFYSYLTAGSTTPIPYTEDSCILPYVSSPSPVSLSAPPPTSLSFLSPSSCTA